MANSGCGICAGIERLKAGASSDLIAELPHSWMVLGDAQLYRGYCVMLAKHHATELFLIPPGEARALFDELLAASAAIATVVKPFKMNYECLGNAEPHVHWHLFPRYADDSMRVQPIWVRPEAERKRDLGSSAKRELVESIRRELARLAPAARIPQS
jgi:diadenosine tetraphosphate (Ap4A) HIT family hydrolase